MREEIKASLQKALSEKLRLSLKIARIYPHWGGELIVEDISISDKEEIFSLEAERAYFTFSLRKLFLEPEKVAKSFRVRMEKAVFFVHGFRLPLEISSMDALLDNGDLELKNVKGKLAGDIPFLLEATLRNLREKIPRMELRCHFFKIEEEKPYFILIPAVISLQGDGKRIFLQGFGEEKSWFRMEGDIFPQEGKFNLLIFPTADREISPLQIEGALKEKRKAIRIKFDHFSLLDNELISQIFIEGEYDPVEKAIQGDFYSSGTVWNYFPFPEMEGKYRFKEGVFSIEDFNWAEAVKISGKIDLLNKLSGEAALFIHNLNLLYLAQFYYPDWNAWGGVSGKTELEIKEGKLLTKGDIEFGEGELGPFKFKGGRIKFEGENNRFKLTDTRVYQDKGYFELSGWLDLKRLGKPDFGKNLVLIPYQERINWQGWSIAQKESAGYLSLDKEIDEKISLQLRTYPKDYREYQDPLKEKFDEFGLEYKLEENRSLKLRLKENEEILGFERKIKF
ncbi:MAG: hypothetical protein NC920_04745 [Candidatus Omnitrophica bacterium]|nr:hypothetical protein [Candidatus Omnitrophota bacterium]MCM8798576.1 hypothetical protein [Candidatus Omnitrophota bacterium]